MEPKTDKRVVSKGAYAAAVGNKAALSSFGVSMMFIGFFGILSVCLIAVLLLFNRPALDTLLLLVLFVGVVGTGSGVLVTIGMHSVQEAKQAETGIPFTRANIANLPAPESLVRASAEPVQAQESVLLRAAIQGHDTPPEQLMRAVNGQE